MTTILLSLLLLVPPPPAVELQNPIIGPNEALGFDYADADMLTYVVVRFEVSWDGGAFVLVQPLPLIFPDTPAGYTTYSMIPPFKSGTHTVSFRACRAEGCGGGSDPFQLRIRRR